MFCLTLTGPAPAQEIELTSAEYAKLDSFEMQILKRADTVFGEALKLREQADYFERVRSVQQASEKRVDANRTFVRAATEYESFIVENERSAAVPYALLRKARSLHLGDKRFMAMKLYEEEILEFFRNNPKIAAAALYYLGLAHWENGDLGAAMKAWKQLADDKEYSKQPLAADAINKLAENFEKQEQAGRAMVYYMQVAVDFRRSNPDAARAAIGKVLAYYVRTEPNEPKLREFYANVDTFHGHPRSAPKDVAGDREYWNFIRQAIAQNGSFNDLQVDLKRRYYGYWADQMQGKFPDWDDFQLDFIAYRREQEQDVARWISRLDQQFNQYQKEGDYDRVVRWIRAYAGYEAKVKEYFQKLNFAKISEPQMYELCRTFLDAVKDYDMATNVASKVRWDEVDDGRLWNPWVYNLRGYRHDALVEELCTRFKEPARGPMELLRYYHHYRGTLDKIMELSAQLVSDPNYGPEASYYRGLGQMRQNQWEEAIKTLRNADNYSPPSAKWQVAECQRKLGKLAAAINELKEIENFYKDSAPEARWRMAVFYNEAGDQKQYIANLRALLKLYPKSSQASNAHNELEKLGVKIGGGVDE